MSIRKRKTICVDQWILDETNWLKKIGNGSAQCPSCLQSCIICGPSTQKGKQFGNMYIVCKCGQKTFRQATEIESNPTKRITKSSNKNFKVEHFVTECGICYEKSQIMGPVRDTKSKNVGRMYCKCSKNHWTWDVVPKFREFCYSDTRKAHKYTPI